MKRSLIYLIITTLVIFNFLINIQCTGDVKSKKNNTLINTKENQCFTNKIIPKKISKATQNDNLNISLLLDLSDRIDSTKFQAKGMEYYQRDIGYIKSVADAFTIHLLSKKMILMNDKIQLFFDPTPNSKNINLISDQLKFQIDKNTITKKLLCKIDSVYKKLPTQIYKQALLDKNYVGSNTWGFFNNKVNQYCIEKEFRNILIIITDGYIYHEDNVKNNNNLTSYLIPQYIKKNRLNDKDWLMKIDKKQFGFLPINQDFSNLEVLVIGIHPDKKNPYEEEVIRAYWSQWLTAMNIKHFALKNADLPSHIDDVIKNFILLKK